MTELDILCAPIRTAKGAIDAQTFVKAYPEEALCNKQGILKLLEAAHASTFIPDN